MEEGEERIPRTSTVYSHSHHAFWQFPGWHGWSSDANTGRQKMTDERVKAICT